MDNEKIVVLAFIGLLAFLGIAALFLQSGEKETASTNYQLTEPLTEATASQSLEDSTENDSPPSKAVSLSSPQIEQGFSIEHHSNPTTMGLQGKVTDSNDNVITDGNIGVKVSDSNSCTSDVFYDVNFINAISAGFFNINVGESTTLSLNFNQDYYMCVYVNGELLSGPEIFRGGQGQISGEDLNDSIDVNYLAVDKNLTVSGIIPTPVIGDVNDGNLAWDLNFNYRKRISFSASDINEDLNYFPFLVKLTSSDFNFINVQVDGDDILFRDPDDNMVLPHHIEKFDSVGQVAYIWVQARKIDKNSSTDYINMYYGHGTTDGNQNETGTYESTAKSIWHGEEGTGTIIDDSTSNDRNGTAASAAIWDTSNTKIGKNVLHPGTGGYHVSIAENADWYASTFTTMAWINSDEEPSGENDTIFGNYDNGDDGWKLQYDSGGPKLLFRTSLNTEINKDKNLTVGTWYHVAVVRDNTTGNGRIYVDGAIHQNGLLDPPSNPANPFYLAKNGIPSDPFEGRIDEIKYYTEAKSLAWIKATYKSEDNNFLTFGAEEFCGSCGSGSTSSSRVTVWGDMEIKGTLYGGSPVKVGSGLKVTGGTIQGPANDLLLGTNRLQDIITDLKTQNTEILIQNLLQAQTIQTLNDRLQEQENKMTRLETANPDLIPPDSNASK